MTSTFTFIDADGNVLGVTPPISEGRFAPASVIAYVLQTKAELRGPRRIDREARTVLVDRIDASDIEEAGYLIRQPVAA